MKSVKVNREEAGLFSEQQIKMVYKQEFYEDFINQPFDIEAFESQMKIKGGSFSKEQRLLLQDALKLQYGQMVISESVNDNIHALSNSNTFTVTTGHQLSLFTGPLYFIVKILHVIKMCEGLKAKYPNNHFVPVYWMATEDHDFEEIQSASLFKKKITWETEQKGPVGRFSLDGLGEVRLQLEELFSNHSDSEVIKAIDSFYGENYAAAMRNLVNHLFADRGLVIIDGDDKALKQSFVPTMKKEVKEQFSFNAVSDTNSLLAFKGAKLQVTPREINLFYIENGVRERIIQEGDKFFIKDIGVHTEETLIDLMDCHPEKFSPNVILRPAYQETILPNLTYVGGAGEISYWLQLKGVFDELKLTYPLIQVRNSVIWLDKPTIGKMDKFGFSTNDIFKDADVWKKEYVQNNSGDDLNFSNLDSQLHDFKITLKSTILTVDQSKEQFANAEIAKLEKQIEAIKAKATKMSKSKHDSVMNFIDQLKSKIFPNNGLQERSVNFFQFCADGKVSSHLSDLYEALDPFEKDLIVLLDD